MSESAVDFLERPPAGWFVLDVMRTKERSWSWCAFMVDVDPDESRHGQPSRSAWVHVPGKHRNWKAAWDALQDMLATRH